MSGQAWTCAHLQHQSTDECMDMLVLALSSGLACQAGTSLPPSTVMRMQLLDAGCRMTLMVQYQHTTNP